MSATQPRLSFDDPKPVSEKRSKQQLIFMAPSLWRAIEDRRGKLSRSAWIERAIKREIAREDGA